MRRGRRKQTQSPGGYWCLLVCCVFVMPGCLSAEEKAQSNESLLAEAGKLHTRAENLLRQGKYTEAIPLSQKALELRETILGPEHCDTN